MKLTGNRSKDNRGHKASETSSYNTLYKGRCLPWSSFFFPKILLGNIYQPIFFVVKRPRKSLHLTKNKDENP